MSYKLYITRIELRRRRREAKHSHLSSIIFAVDSTPPNARLWTVAGSRREPNFESNMQHKKLNNGNMLQNHHGNRVTPEENNKERQ